MAITYANFLTQVRDYTEVDSNVLTDSIIDNFIRNTELNVAGQVDYDDLRKYSTSSFTSGNRAVSLPADCMIMRSVQVINGSGATGLPKFWANWDDFNIIVAPTPDSAYTIQINFIKDPPHFSATNNTFLSTYQESMLLHGALTEAFSYLKGPQDLYTLYKSKYDEEVQAFALQQMGRRRRGEYDSGVPRIKIPSPSP